MIGHIYRLYNLCPLNIHNKPSHSFLDLPIIPIRRQQPIIILGIGPMQPIPKLLHTLLYTGIILVVDLEAPSAGVLAGAVLLIEGVDHRHESLAVVHHLLLDLLHAFVVGDGLVGGGPRFVAALLADQLVAHVDVERFLVFLPD